MTEQASEPAADAQAPREASPRPRRRRRGGRGRRRGGSASRPSTPEQSSTQADSEEPQEGGKQSAAKTATRKKATTRRKPAAKATPSTRRRSRSRSSGSKASTDGQKDEQKGGAAKTAQRGSGGRSVSEETGGDGQAGSSATRRRRRRRRRRPSEGPETSSQTAPARKTEAKAEPGRRRAPAKRRGTKAPAKGDEAVAVAPPTRTSRRAARKPGARRRPAPIAVERRTDKRMLITRSGERDQIAVVEGRELAEHYVTRSGSRSMVGNIYLGRVQNVLPGMEAAFVDVGRGRNAVLYAGEVSYDEEVEGEERRIEKVLKSGQSVLVQVTKDPMGGKGARLTAQISLPGRYLVYLPEDGASGISRRLPEKERLRLRDIVKEVRPKGAGVIVRTAAEGASAEDLAADLERLKSTWDSIKKKSKRAKAPAALYEEPELTVRVVRDAFSPTEFQEVVTDSPEVYDTIRAYLEDVGPDLLERVRLEEGELPLFEAFHVSEQIHKALERKVWLPSGGYVIIDRTEALTIIDVNTGKSVGKSNLEETVFGTNVEAAREIARQLRLRDIGGIIVIDFIDMLLGKNRDTVVDTLKEALAHDKTRSQVFDITPLGLLEMTRKKVSQGLVESFSETCPTCEGRGILLTHDVS